jgi:hypothetical protein
VCLAAVGVIGYRGCRLLQHYLPARAEFGVAREHQTLGLQLRPRDTELAPGLRLRRGRARRCESCMRVHWVAVPQELRHGAPIGPADHPLIACPDDAAFNPPSFLTRPTPNTDAAPWAPSHCTVPKLSTEVSILIESAPHWPAGRPLRWPPSAPRLGRRSWGSAPTKSTHVSCFSGQKGPNWAMHGHAQAGWLADRSTEIL